LLSIFRIVNSQGERELEPVYWSIVSIGTGILDAARESDRGKMIWLQIVWFLLGVIFPLLSNVLYLALLWAPAVTPARHLETLFHAAEFGFAWNCAEVFVISTIFAVVEIPNFGNGLIDAGCSACYVVGAELLPELAVMAVGTVINLFAGFWTYVAARRGLYHGRERIPQEQYHRQQPVQKSCWRRRCWSLRLCRWCSCRRRKAIPEETVSPEAEQRV
jgi:hypothetical protein